MGVNSTTGVPINRTASFSHNSLAVYSWLNFTNVPRPEHNVTWLYVMPNGTLYYNGTAMTTDPGVGYTWSSWAVYSYIHISGYQAANVTGTWTVDIYVDGRPSLSRTLPSPKSAFTRRLCRTWSRYDNMSSGSGSH